MKFPTSLAILLGISLTNAGFADNYTLVMQPPNGYRVPKIIGASGTILSDKTFTGLDYFEWFGITHYRYWFTYAPTIPSGSITTVDNFVAARTALRANPLRQRTGTDLYFDWNHFRNEFSHPTIGRKWLMDRLIVMGIKPVMINPRFTTENPLTSWGAKYEYWKMWYAYVYHFASLYDVTLFQISNEPNAYTQANPYTFWESHWPFAADAIRTAIADVNRDFGKQLRSGHCGPVTSGPYWDYNFPDPNVDRHGWGSTSWSKVQTDIFGNVNPNIWNYDVYDYHSYTANGLSQQTLISNLRNNMATARNSPNATMPILVSEYNTATGGHFTERNIDTEDLRHGISMAHIMQSTAILGPNGLGDEGGLLIFKLGHYDANSTLQNKLGYMSGKGDGNHGGITRGGASFQMYTKHFRGGKPILGFTVTAGDNSGRRTVAALDEAKKAYYIYSSNISGTDASVSIDLSALDVQIGTPVTVQRVDANNTGQITDYLAIDSLKKINFSAPNYTAFFVSIPKGQSAGQVAVQRPAKDTYLVVGEGAVNHSTEQTMKVSLHRSTPSERRLGFMQFDLGSIKNGNRYLLKLSGKNSGAGQTAREILHLYGAGAGGFSDTDLTWSTAPAVGKYYLVGNIMNTTTGLAPDMSDIEDNHAGVARGTGLGIYGKFLGPVSFFSATWKDNYIDVTDYVRSLLAANHTSVTFLIARIVRYDVNQYVSTYYQQGVYDCDGRVVEIGTKENTAVDLRPGLYVFNDTPPAAPTALAANVTTGNQIDLTWVDNANNETGFILDRARDATFTLGPVSRTLAANVTSFIATGLSPDTTFYYRVRATGNGGNSALSNVVSVTTGPEIPAPATSPVPTDGANGIATSTTLEWESGARATAHLVHFGVTNPPSVLGEQTGVSFPLSGLLANTKYFWRVDEKNITGTTVGAVWNFRTSPLLDTVGDGVPDAWRANFFGGDGSTASEQSLATADPDGDGATNRDEYLAGTDPVRGTEYIHVNIQSAGPDIVLSWPTVLPGALHPGFDRYYALEALDTLDSTDPTTLGQWIATGGERTYTTTFTGQKFFRVRVWLQLR